ncbi:putative helicase mov-10-B.1 [Bradysia coprophila]|uniref:putative helicase mov-10-B.1 n=1 Tax=Bradysia coprophila TaxID=38358 RepID=UPI00187DCDE5|nr:putative helicase mov-10-B.1 [Bradysia coprophila]
MLSKKNFVGSFYRLKNNDFITNENGCYLCGCNLSDTNAYQSHMKHHLDSVRVGESNAIWKSFGNVELIGLTLAANQEDSILNLANNSDDVVKITQIAIFNEALIHALIDPDLFPVSLGVDDEVSFKRQLSTFCDKNHVAIVFEMTSNKVNYEVVQSYNCVESDEEPPAEVRRSPIQPEDRIKISPMLFKELTTSCSPPESQGYIKLGKLPDYLPTVEIKSLYQVDFFPNRALTENEEKIRKSIVRFEGPLTPSNYYDMLTIMVQIEDIGACVSRQGTTKRGRSLVKVDNGYQLKLSKREGRPLFLVAGDTICIRGPAPKDRNYGYVQYVSSTEIKMTLSKAIVEKKPLYSIHFYPNRLAFKLQRLGLDAAKKLDIIDLLFPESNKIDLSNQPKILPLDIHHKGLKEDRNQVRAVNHIVAGTAYPLPYVLIGFPGTGKTAIIVESIYQLWRMKTTTRILVCAQSNSVCDEITERLIALLPKKSVQNQHNIIRLFAGSAAQNSFNSDDLLENSNSDDNRIPCLTELYKYRIIVTTLNHSGRLLQAGMKSDHFTHLFIDECENATEPSTLLPIALCSSKKKINAHIVLSGDPYQLGPVVRENMAEQMTLGVSMLKRLSEHPLYQKRIESNSYDQRITCRLQKNYRSHPDLVKMASELFYGSEMKDSIPRIGSAYERIRSLTNLDILPKKGFPILFEHVDGTPERKENCTSWYNEIDALSVLHYVETLLRNEPQEIKESDIGIVAAYKRQVVHIKDLLEEDNYSGIEVGTVEQFQGREKPIIILSTVRNGDLGFLEQRERINVMLTRATGLLIIIGHTKTLRKCDDWRKIIDHTSDECGGEIVAEYIEDVGDYRC